MTALALEPEPDRPQRCFVIGPIGDSDAEHGSPEREAYEHHLEVFEQVIAPACEKFGIIALRADYIANAGDINEQICRYVIESDLVIADISGGNPNVMYELGLRHLTGRPTIHIGEREQLPFNIAAVRTVEYRRLRSSLSRARRGIEDALEAGFRDGFEILTPARVLRAIGPDAGAASEPAPEEGEDDPPGLLDNFAAVEDGMNEMVVQLDTIVKAIEAIGSLTEQSNAELSQLARANVPMASRLAAVARFAESLGAPAGEMHSAAMDLTKLMATMDSGMHAALSLVEETPPAKRDAETIHFLEQLVSLEENTRISMAQLAGLGEAAGTMTRVSRHLRKPVKDMTTAVREMGSATTCIGAWADRARSLLPSDAA